MLAPLASTFYFLWVVIGFFFNLDTFYPHQVANILFNSRSQHLRPLINLLEIHVSIRAEMPLHLFVIKCLAIGIINTLGGFDYWFAWLIFYILDIPNLLACLYMFWEMNQEQLIFMNALQPLPLSKQIDLRKKWVLRLLMNPLWQPRNVSVTSNITYATKEELEETMEKQRLQLDVYSLTSSADRPLRPVLMHIHGGGWQQGTKNIFYPFEKILVAQENWVVVNMTYRLAPNHPYPAQLYDIKRALRWVKQSIQSYGGDPNFIVLSGDSSGAQLAALVALTANEPEWQPGFESVDTSIRGVISLNGILDIQSDQVRKTYFTHKVALLDEIDPVFLDRHSPLYIVKHQETRIPFLVITGQRDMMVDTTIGINFKTSMDYGSNPDLCTLLVIPGAHHVWYLFWSLRSLYGAHMIQAWCRQLYSIE
ncbi:Alpha/Beta hydrolase protein [Chlamydoabsidia padenii]|nr:Alpha/Beta hydrolase protein [Chlamydoabsidia padenii]